MKVLGTSDGFIIENVQKQRGTSKKKKEKERKKKKT